MIIGTAVVLRQVQFAKNRPNGYGREGLIMVRLYSADLHKNINAFTNDLLQTRQVIAVAESGNQVTKGSRTSSDFYWQGKQPNNQIEFAIFAVSPQYGKTVGWQLTDGRDFLPFDSSGLVLNQSAVKYMGLKNPVGQIISWDDKKYTLLGVTKDMIIESPYDPIKPTIFYTGSWPGIINIRINPAVSTSGTINKIEAICKKYAPGDPFDYKFVDQEYAQKFGDEERVGQLAGFFAGLAIFISCLGLFGMASFMAEQRVKEIGVRKVLGASVFNLWRLLSKDFVVLVIIALLIASPAAYYFMHNWLQNYVYRTEIAWWIFAATALGAIAITLATISYQGIKAALANPVKSLRSE
jgi:ABC-type antimicrobial peptide transport system permease subunit